MKKTFHPRDFGIWLDLIDVNCLSAVDADQLAAFDIDDDSDLQKMIGDWIKPKFEENDAQNRSEMIAILEHSKQWTVKELQPVFSEIGTPSGQEVHDISRFMTALRRQILA